MFKVVGRTLLAALLVGTSGQAIAQSSGWVISETSGAVYLDQAGQRTAAKRGTPIQPGDTITTGAKSRAVLVHQRDFVTVAANSRICIPEATRGSTITRFFQDMGNAIFRVEKRKTPHFSVDTPYLAAVVKGTTFSITVGRADTSLQVTEGVVEVSTSDGGARQLVRPGSVAMISASDRYRLTVAGDQPTVVDSPARADLLQEPAAPTAIGSDAQSLDIEADAGASIKVSISSKPIDMGKATSGVLTGGSPIVLAALTDKQAPVGTPGEAATGNNGSQDDKGKADDKGGSDDGDKADDKADDEADDKGDKGGKGGKGDDDDDDKGGKGGKGDDDDDDEKGGKDDDDD